MKKLVIAFAIMALFVGVASAKVSTDYATDFQGPNRVQALYGYFDMTDVTGFVTVDNTAVATPHFHVDSYMAYDFNHWWCGNFNFDANGGYGNGWIDLLLVPTTDVTGAYYPVLTFVHYYDSEPAYDFTYVDVKVGGVYVAQNAGYDGLIPGGTWVDLGAYGFVLAGADNPVDARFRFVADGAWSDEDGLYDSIGGAYMVDDVKIFDFYGGAVYFFDDVETGGLCIPAVLASAGDYWHLVNDVCSSNVIPSWWCGDDADTSLIPPNLDNSLITAGIDISTAYTCTVRWAIHAEVPTVDNDYWTDWVIVDGTAYQTGAWWGDFAGCAGFGTSGLNGVDISGLMPAVDLKVMWVFHTTDNGCGPGAAGGAGINVDDTWAEGDNEWPTAVEESSWGSIKSMYR